jgi:hypothetical protein
MRSWGGCWGCGLWAAESCWGCASGDSLSVTRPNPNPRPAAIGVFLPMEMVGVIVGDAINSHQATQFLSHNHSGFSKKKRTLGMLAISPGSVTEL